MRYKPDNVREKKYLEKRDTFFRQAASGGKGSIYAYGFKSISEDAKRFIAEGKHEITPCSRHYKPNPYFYQYDLEVHIFFNYDSVVSNEIKLWDNRLSQTNNDKEIEEIEFRLSMLDKYGTGISRDEHLWNATSIRWPTTKVGEAEHGSFVKEPWGEDFVSGLCSHDYVNVFGGSGQGKTHRALAFMSIGWDHYIDTMKGGRGIFSTVSESKMKQSTWPYLCGIYKETVGSPYDSEKREPVSLYAGRGLIRGEFTIARPNDPKGGGMINGLLLSNRVDGSAVVDKITGAHGHPFGMYHIDEIQSTPDAPIKASSNFKMNCTHSWITSAGNFDLETDALGKNVIPINGWGSVDEKTHIYESINMLGIRALCIHYNNEMSPAMTEKGAARWGHMLPTKKKRDSVYTTAASKRTDEYRRFWKGWKKKADASDSVLNKGMIESMGCHLNTEFDTKYPVYHGFSLDTAPASLDRNIVTHFADGVCKKTGLWKVHIYEAIALEKNENLLQYVRKTGDKLIELASKWGVMSGRATMDWTNMTGIPEYLKDRGFNIQTISYNEAPPNGVKVNKKTLEKEPPILLDSNSNKYAHEVVTNLISAGAYAIQQMVIHGQITGLNENLVNRSNSDNSFDEEICKRAFIKEPSADYGERYKLEPKSTKGKKSADRGVRGFKETYGFSPDILDTIFQIGLYMVTVRKMTIGDRRSSTSETVHKKDNRDIEEGDKIYSRHAEIWLDDLIEIG